MSKKLSIRRCAVLALVLGAMTVSRPASVRVQAQAAQTFDGTLSIMWGDPRFPGSAGDVRYMLETPDGRYVQVQYQGDLNAALRYRGKHVLVTGRSASTTPFGGAAGDPVIVADRIDDDPRAPLASAAGPSLVSGTKRVIFLLTKFSDDTAVPHGPAFYLNMANPDVSGDPQIPGTINAFFKKLSNNTFSWVADVGGAGGVGAPGGWITLPQPKSYYANCNFSVSCFSSARYNTDAVAAGKAQGINFAVYDNVNFVMSNDLDCCAWGGNTSIDGRFMGATWEPPWGQVTST